MQSVVSANPQTWQPPQPQCCKLNVNLHKCMLCFCQHIFTVFFFLVSLFSPVRSQARGVHSQRSHQPSRQPSRQQGQQSPWQRRLRRIRAPGRSVRLLRHFRYPATTGQWGQTLQDPHHLQEDPQPKNPGICEEINPPTEKLEELAVGGPLLSAILGVPASLWASIHRACLECVHYDWYFPGERRRWMSWVNLRLVLSPADWKPAQEEKILVWRSQARVCGVKKKRLFPFKKRPQFAFQSPASSFRSSPPARNQTQTDPMWCCLTLCYKLLSRSDTQTHILTQSRCREWDTPPPPQLQKQKKLKWHSGKKKKKKEFVGYYFGLWARCLSDELKKKICNDCHVASPALVGEKKSHLSRSTEAGNAVWLPQRPTSDSEDRRWRCCSWGQTLTHSNAAEPTPPDRWNVKTGLAGVRLGGFVTCLRYNPTHTEIRNHKLAIERTIFMATHSTNSTLLTIHDMRNLT